MAKNKMSDLRNHLFETLEQLKDTDKPLDLARAKTISEVAQTIINSAKVEIQFIEAIGAASGSEFFEAKRIPAGADGRTAPVPLRRTS